MKYGRVIQLFMAAIMTASLAAGCAPTAEQSQQSVTQASPTAVEEGSEGSPTSDAATDLMTNLGLMKGHLMVAQELMAKQQYKEAAPHIGHPVEEIYGDVEAALTKRQIPQFKDTLNKMSDLIKSAPESPELQAAYDESIKAIDAAIAALPAEKRQSPDFVMKVMAGLLGTAADEYKAAIANGKFVELVEYQDSRGFVMYAEELYKTAPQTDAAKNEAITKAFTELKTAWPAVNPPATPVKTPEEVSTLVQQIAGKTVAMGHSH